MMRARTSSMPRKAVVLAAGLGLRLRPLTLFRPKPLMRAGGVPLIEWTLARLESWGVEEIAVNMHWQASLLRDHLVSRRGAARITCSREPCLLGTAGALRPLRGFIGDDPFWLVNADIFWRVQPRLLWRAFVARQPLAAVWLVTGKGPRTVETDAADTIVTYRSARAGEPGTATFSGVQVVAPRILGHLPPGRAACGLIEVYESAAAAGERVTGVRAPGRPCWEDAGSVPDYLRLRRRLRRRAAPRGGKGGAAAGGDGFRAGRGGRLWFPAHDWPDVALAPVLLGMGWPPAGTEVEPLPVRGSDRSFLRLRHEGRTAIYIRHGKERAENGLYAAHARLLRAAGVAVPRVLADWPEGRALVLSDAGRSSLCDLVRADPAAAERLYRQLLPVVLRLHTKATRLAASSGLPLTPPFDARLYRWERNLFLDLLVRRRRHVPGAVPAAVTAEYDKVARKLLATPRTVLLHRDLQSANVMVRGGRLTLIDFQGMRFGPAAYDLASLLCDPYVGLPASLRERLLEVYAAAAGADGPAVARLFPWAAVQRLTQALGAYGRLTSLGLRGWERHIAPAARLLAEMAGRCGLDAIAGLAATIAGREENAAPA